jgi:hypothetical protein
MFQPDDDPTIGVETVEGATLFGCGQCKPAVKSLVSVAFVQLTVLYVAASFPKLVSYQFPVRDL